MYCTRCGRKLEEGEVCTCTQENQEQVSQEETVQEDVQKNVQNDMQESVQEKNIKEKLTQAGKSIDTDWAVEKGKSFLSAAKEVGKDILYALRNPVSRSVALAEEDSKEASVRIIGFKAVLLTVIVLILVNMFNSKTQGYLEIPYFSTFLLMLILTAGADYLEMLLLKITTGIVNGKSAKNAIYSVISGRDVFDLAIMLITFILFKLSESIWMYVGGALIFLDLYMEFAAYRAVVEMSEDKKVYVFFITKIITVSIVVFLTLLMGKDIVNDIMYFMY